MNAEDTLQFCLEEIEAGRLTPVECLARFPEAADLPAQLQAVQLLRAAPPAELSAEASAALKTRLSDFWQLRTNGRRAEAVPPRPARASRLARGWRAFSPMLRLASALTAVVLIAAVSGAFSAAQASLPGDWLYPVKRLGERVQMSLTPDTGLARLHWSLLQERSRELQALSEASLPSPLLAQAAEALAVEAEAAWTNIPKAPPGQHTTLLSDLLAALETEEAVLTALLKQAPAEAVPALTAALEQIRSHRIAAEAAREAMSGTNDTPPGQTQVPFGQTMVPPGQTRRPDQTNPPPGQTKVPPGQQTDAADPTRTPRFTRTPRPTLTPRPTFTPRPTNANSGGQPNPPNCSANNPNSPNYCTPTPAGNSNLGAAPTACPTNPGGQARCR